MHDDIFSDLAIEKVCKSHFNVVLDIHEVLVRAIPCGLSMQATLFKADGQLLLYIACQGSAVLDDIRKVVQRMNCEADYFYPPQGEADYFKRIASDKFKTMFPGKHITSEEDLRYYKNLAPYAPALVRIAKVKGELLGFDRTTKAWRKVLGLSYAKMNVQ